MAALACAKSRLLISFYLESARSIPVRCNKWIILSTVIGCHAAAASSAISPAPAHAAA
jgi:hypothetical protein